MNYRKLDKRINEMLKYENDDFFINIEMEEEITEKLLDYQYLHILNMISALKKNNIILDGSDTGTGKTYCALAVCKYYKYKPMIICPKTIISTWKKVCEYFNIEPLTIVNYETIKNGKMYDKNKNRIECPYIKIDEEYKNERRYIWKMPKKSIIIFDEVHKCRNKNSMNGKLLLSTKETKQKIILLSATISDTINNFHVFGYMLNLYKSLRQANNWIKGIINEDKNYIGNKPKSSTLHKSLYPFKGSRIQISELGEQFPRNQIVAELYDISKKEEKIINNIFEQISIANLKLKSIKDKREKGSILKNIIKLRQKIEIIKIPIIESLTLDYIENGYNVVIFVNFNETIKRLSEILNTKCIINGEYTNERRERNIEEFQKNKEKIILCNIKAGGQSINLHDKYGRPRISLISPSFSSTELIQALGRIHRAESKSPAIQRMIFCANTIEKKIAEKLNHKIKFLSDINNDDLFINKNFITFK